MQKSSNAEIFPESKAEYETALKNIGHKNVDFKCNLVNKNTLLCLIVVGDGISRGAGVEGSFLNFHKLGQS